MLLVFHLILVAVSPRCFKWSMFFESIITSMLYFFSSLFWRMVCPELASNDSFFFQSIITSLLHVFNPYQGVVLLLSSFKLSIAHWKKCHNLCTSCFHPHSRGCFIRERLQIIHWFLKASPPPPFSVFSSPF